MQPECSLRVHTSPTLICILSNINPDHALISLFRRHLNITHPSTTKLFITDKIWRSSTLLDEWSKLRISSISMTRILALMQAECTQTQGSVVMEREPWSLHPMIPCGLLYKVSYIDNPRTFTTNFIGFYRKRLDLICSFSVAYSRSYQHLFNNMFQ
jgi:hypothetical protein